MKTKLFAIAKITRATGLKGDVSVRPLIRLFDEYVDRDLFIGFDKNFAKDVKLPNVSGTNKKPRFHFEGLDSRDDAEAMIGQLLFASIHEKDPINLISPDLIGATVVTVSGEQIGELVDMMRLPAHDAYVISSNNKEVLIPVVPEFIYSVDVTASIVTISPVEGLLD